MRTIFTTFRDYEIFNLKILCGITKRLLYLRPYSLQYRDNAIRIKLRMRVSLGMSDERW